jgi:hypothetical protein
MSRSTQRISSRSAASGHPPVSTETGSVVAMVKLMRRWGTRKAALTLAALAMTMTGVGCHNPFAIYQHRTTSYDFHGQPNVAFYHYPHGSWFIPAQQKHHCPTVVEAPFHGFQATCWTQWPEPWTQCPPPGMAYPVTEGEVIDAPQHDEMPSPTPVPPNNGAQELPAQDPAARAAPTPARRVASRPVDQPRADAAPALQAPTEQVPAEVKPVTTPARPFIGRHGFTTPADSDVSSAAAIELPARTDRR